MYDKDSTLAGRGGKLQAVNTGLNWPFSGYMQSLSFVWNMEHATLLPWSPGLEMKI